MVGGQFALTQPLGFWPQFLGTPPTVSINLGRFCRQNAELDSHTVGASQRRWMSVWASLVPPRRQLFGDACTHHYSSLKSSVVIKVKTRRRDFPWFSEGLLQNQLSLCFKSILAKG